MDPPSDAAVIGRSLDEPEALGLVYDRHAATVLRFLGRRVGAEAAEGLLGELFRIAFERHTTFDVARVSALPWLYGIGSNLLLKHRRAGPAAARERPDGGDWPRRGQTHERRGLRRARAVSARGRRDRRAAGLGARDPPPFRLGGAPVRERGPGSRGAHRHGPLPAQPRPRASARTARAERERKGKITMKPVDLAKKLRREAAFEPAVLDRGKAALMAAIRQEVQPMRRPTIIPRLPYENVGAALSFLERAFGFREVAAARGVRADGAIDYTMVEFGDGMIGLGAQGAHGAFSPKRAGTATQYITVHVDDIDAHHQRALASGAEIVSRLHDHLQDYRVYEALDLEGHRWRFLQWLREVPQSERR